jgi:hypothetical protein
MAGWDERLDAAYDWCVRLADALFRRRRLALCLGLPLVLGLTLAINRFVLHDFPNSGDEYVYLYQARTMAEGRLSNQAPPWPPAFVFTYITEEGGRIYGTFPFGWPVALTLALLLRFPVWLVNPLLGVTTVILAGVLGTRLYGPRAGVWSAIVVGTMPYVLFNAASYFSHTFCGALLLGAACLAARVDRRPRHALLIGALLAWAVLARYYTGVLCGVPIVLLLLRPPAAVSSAASTGPVPPAIRYRRFVTRMLLCVILGGVPGIVALAGYDLRINGSPWHLTTGTGTYNHWFGSGFAMRGVDILSTNIVRHLLWTPPAIVILYVVYLWTIPRARRTTLDWMLAATAVTLFFYLERGGNQYGTRFHYEAFLFATVFVVGQLFRRESLAGARPGDRRAFGFFAVSLLVLPLQFGLHAVIEERVIRERLDPYRMARQAGLHDAVVFMDGLIGTARPMYARDLTRNGLTYDGSVLYALDAGAPTNCDVMTHYPGRTAYRYVWNVERREGTLSTFDCNRSGERK